LGQVSWATYEGARNPYVLLVTIYLFAPYFTTTVVGDPVRGQQIWAAISSWGAFATALAAPFLGAIADVGGRRKPWIGAYTAIMVVAMLLMWRATPHASLSLILLTGLLVIVANFAFEFSNVFLSAMLPTIAPANRIGPLSGLGLSLGNAAGIVLMIFMLIAFALPGKVHWPFVPSHPLFGIDQAANEPDRLAGPISGIWLLFLSMPLFLFTPDKPSAGLPVLVAMRNGVQSVIGTVKSLRHYRNVAHYLMARMIFNDGMSAVLLFGGIYAAGTFHWGNLQMLVYGLELSVFAVVGGFFGGWLDNRFGSKRAIYVSIGGTSIFFAASLLMAPDPLVHSLRRARAAYLVAAVLQQLAASHLPDDRQWRRGLHHGRLCQCPHHAGPDRTAREDDGILRLHVALRLVDDLSRQCRRDRDDCAHTESTRRHRDHSRLPAWGPRLDDGGEGRTRRAGDSVVRNQKSEVRSQKAEVRNKKSEGRNRSSNLTSDFRLLLVPELADAAEHHGDAGRVRRGDHVLVVDRTAGLDDRRGAGLDNR
jgi:MFS-type transporter involved in bile tolerance (Atg22 family)